MLHLRALRRFKSTDFERRRQERETTNERIVSGILVGILALVLVMETVWSDLAVVDSVKPIRDFQVSPQMKWATVATLVGHACLLAFLHFQPRYFAARKYLIVLMRILFAGGVCWADRYHVEPQFGLLMPLSFFVLVIVTAGLTYSRLAVLLAGGLAIVTFATLTLLGPMWPLSLRATSLGIQVFIALTLVTWYIVSSMRTMTAEAVVNERLNRFFSPEISELIATEPEITVHAAERLVTVLFSDISGFTSMSSRMRPEQVVDLLNAYLPEMVEIIFRHGGTLEKFVGDAVLAVWGAPVVRPDDADRAVTAALEMQAAVERFNESRTGSGAAKISLHIGIATGQAAAGYIGTDSYMQYAVIGDTTNVASRICSAACPGEILVGEQTQTQVSPAAFELELAEPIIAKGKDEPVRVYRVRRRTTGSDTTLPSLQNSH